MAAPRLYGLTLGIPHPPAPGLWDGAEENTLTGLFLREMRRWLERPPMKTRAAVELAARFGLAALESGEDAAL